jgi:hypothetical protein
MNGLPAEGTLFFDDPLANDALSDKEDLPRRVFACRRIQMSGSYLKRYY